MYLKLIVSAIKANPTVFIVYNLVVISVLFLLNFFLFKGDIWIISFEKHLISHRASVESGYDYTSRHFILKVASEFNSLCGSWKLKLSESSDRDYTWVLNYKNLKKNDVKLDLENILKCLEKTPLIIKLKNDQLLFAIKHVPKYEKEIAILQKLQENMANAIESGKLPKHDYVKLIKEIKATNDNLFEQKQVLAGAPVFKLLTKVDSKKSITFLLSDLIWISLFSIFSSLILQFLLLLKSKIASTRK